MKNNKHNSNHILMLLTQIFNQKFLSEIKSIIVRNTFHKIVFPFDNILKGFGVIFCVLLSINSSAQYHISGIVTDRQTGERLIGANVVEYNTTNGTSTDNNGYFSLISQGNKMLVSFIGYQKQEHLLTSDTVLFISLNAGEILNEILVEGKHSEYFNITSLSSKEMLEIPALGGKPDVLKALQLMPGIQSQQEGSSLINVRGGNPGENLYLIDNIPLIYVNHLGGFISVFNPDMINGIDVYKGGFPAKYGGKLSSIVAITQREGDKSKLKGTLGIGITDASFSVEGPLLDKKASFILTGRKTLIDPFMLLASGLSGGGDYFLFYGFHDLNGKFSWHPNSKNNFYVNFYQGDDYIRYWSKDNGDRASLGYTWGNNMIAVRWNCMLTPRLFFDNTVSYTRYRSKTVSAYESTSSSDTTSYENRYLSSVRDLSLRSDWHYKLMKKWDVEFGTKMTHYSYMPNKIEQSNSTITSANEIISPNEFSGYLSSKATILNTIEAETGIRFVNYNVSGYNQAVFEPRLILNAKLADTWRLNFTWQKVYQFSQLLFTAGSIFNSEVWVPADEDVDPSYSIQYSCGIKGRLFDGVFEAEIDAYYKELNQLITYKEGYSNLLGDGNWRNKLETDGTGNAKGVELLVRKVKGDWTGFLAYTLSKATRQYPGIDNGEEFVFNYDRPHAVSINVSHKINELWKFNATWVYQTGLPYTPVLGRQVIAVNDGDNTEYEEAYIYGERNSERMKDYHRLDLGFIRSIQTKRGRNAEWCFSVYNAYCRRNPSMYYYASDINGEQGITETDYSNLKQYQISYFPIIPTVSYKVYFE